MKNTEMLKKNYEFRRVLTRGKYYSGQQIEAFILKNHKEINLLGLAISVKIGKATTRNHIKRLVKENYTKLEENLTTGNSIVFLWKKKVDPVNASFDNVRKDLKNILEKAEILEKSKV